MRGGLAALTAYWLWSVCLASYQCPRSKPHLGCCPPLAWPPSCITSLSIYATAAAGVVSLGRKPSANCTLRLTVRPVANTIGVDPSGQAQCMLRVQARFSVRGPSPACDGSYGALRVRGERYLAHLDFWNGRHDITSPQTVVKTRSGADGASRSQVKSLLLPGPGVYGFELKYDYRAYAGMFDRCA